MTQRQTPRPRSWSAFARACRNLRRQPRKAYPPPPRAAVRPSLEALEDRTVPAGSVQLSKGVLLITGTDNPDTAKVREVAGPGNQGPQVEVTLNGQIFTFKATAVNEIRAQLNAGNDTFTLDESSL